MERAAASIAKLKGSSGMTPENLAHAAWPVAVGKKIAARTVPCALVRDRLVVEVEDAVWQRQLFSLRFQMIHEINKVVGEKLLADLEFRIGVKRRPAQVADRIDSTDEANLIEDPTFRILYKRARNKASA